MTEIDRVGSTSNGQTASKTQKQSAIDLYKGAIRVEFRYGLDKALTQYQEALNALNALLETDKTSEIYDMIAVCHDKLGNEKLSKAALKKSREELAKGNFERPHTPNEQKDSVRLTSSTPPTSQPKTGLAATREILYTALNATQLTKPSNGDALIEEIDSNIPNLLRSKNPEGQEQALKDINLVVRYYSTFVSEDKAVETLATYAALTNNTELTKRANVSGFGLYNRKLTGIYVKFHDAKTNEQKRAAIQQAVALQATAPEYTKNHAFYQGRVRNTWSTMAEKTDPNTFALAIAEEHSASLATKLEIATTLADLGKTNQAIVLLAALEIEYPKENVALAQAWRNIAPKLPESDKANALVRATTLETAPDPGLDDAGRARLSAIVNRPAPGLSAETKAALKSRVDAVASPSHSTETPPLVLPPQSAGLDHFDSLTADEEPAAPPEKPVGTSTSTVRLTYTPQFYKPPQLDRDISFPEFTNNPSREEEPKPEEAAAERQAPASSSKGAPQGVSPSSGAPSGVVAGPTPLQTARPEVSPLPPSPPAQSGRTGQPAQKDAGVQVAMITPSSRPETPAQKAGARSSGLLPPQREALTKEAENLRGELLVLGIDRKDQGNETLIASLTIHRDTSDGNLTSAVRNGREKAKEMTLAAIEAELNKPDLPTAQKQGLTALKTRIEKARSDQLVALIPELSRIQRSSVLDAEIASIRESQRKPYILSCAKDNKRVAEELAKLDPKYTGLVSESQTLIDSMPRISAQDAEAALARLDKKIDAGLKEVMRKYGITYNPYTGDLSYNKQTQETEAKLDAFIAAMAFPVVGDKTDKKFFDLTIQEAARKTSRVVLLEKGLNTKINTRYSNFLKSDSSLTGSLEIQWTSSPNGILNMSTVATGNTRLSNDAIPTPPELEVLAAMVPNARVRYLPGTIPSQVNEVARRIPLEKE